MRVTQNLLMDNYLYNQKKITQKNYDLQNQLATNSKINTISDDLSTSLELINMNGQLRKNETFQKNIQNAREYANTTTSCLDSVINEAQKIMVEMTNLGDPTNQINIPTIKDKIKDSLTMVTQALNTKYNGMYVFGGTNFQTDPFGTDVDGKSTVLSADMSGAYRVQISSSTNEKINVTGDDIVNTNLLDTINQIIDKLDANEVPDQALQSQLEDAYKAILNVQTLNGNKINKLNDMEQIVGTQNDNLNTLFVQKQQVDVAKVIVDLQNQDYLLQMSYKLASSILPKSLLDYL